MSEKCASVVQKAIMDQFRGSDLTIDEARNIVDAAKKEYDRLRRRVGREPLPMDIAKSAERRQQMRQHQLQAEKYRVYRDNISKADLIREIGDTWKDDPVSGVRNMIFSSQSERAGARNSAEFAVEAVRNRAEKHLDDAVKTKVPAELRKPLARGELDEDLAEILEGFSNGRMPENVTKPLVPFAEEIHRVSEDLRRQANDLGIDIGELKGYVTSMAHDEMSINRAGQAKWVSDTMPLVDESFFDGLTMDGRVELMNQLWEDFVSGAHHFAATAGGSGRIANRALTRSRVIPWKDGRSFAAYNRLYGQGTVLAAVHRTVRRKAVNIGIAAKLGPNYRKNMVDVVESLAKGADVETAQRLRDFASSGSGVSDMDKMFDVLDGTINIPARGRFAGLIMRVTNTIKEMNILTKLGGASISAMTDSAYVAGSLSNAGGDFVGSIVQHYKSLFTNSKQTREIADRILFMAHDNWSQMIDDANLIGPRQTFIPKWMPSATKFLQITGLDYVTKQGARTAAAMHAELLGKNAGKAFNELSEETRRVLSRSGIGDVEWDIFRKYQAHKLDDGKMYITADNIDNLPDDVVKAYASRSIPVEELTQADVSNARATLERKIQGYYLDRASEAVTLGSAAGRSMMKLKGARPGEAMWALNELFWQFKGFTIHLMHGSLGRELKHIGGGQGFWGKASRMGNLARMVTTASALGMIISWAKDLTKLRSPNVPQDAKGAAGMIARGIMQGGGLGIFGDLFIGSATTRHGQSMWSTILGPTAGAGEELMKLNPLGLGIGDKKPEGLTAGGIRFLMNHMMPFGNLPIARGLLDQLVLYEIFDYLNPGYMRRMQRRLKKEMGQQMLLAD